MTYASSRTPPPMSIRVNSTAPRRSPASRALSRSLASTVRTSRCDGSSTSDITGGVEKSDQVCQAYRPSGARSYALVPAKLAGVTRSGFPPPFSFAR
jgi:hypothetical protein